MSLRGIRPLRGCRQLCFYHLDIGFEAFIPSTGNQIYFYDFATGHWFYTSPSYPFPYRYDFILRAILYYYPDTLP
jgi:hypothetical protein